MLASGAFTALFGLGYFYNIHSLGFYVVTQVRKGLIRDGKIRSQTKPTSAKRMDGRCWGGAEQHPSLVNPAAGVGRPTAPVR